ncbi:hypothetical protein M758_UG299300 [Ceratodon purpureus]|nr:hypothetical protein M758_UG299300 [Ceratodon purpureus]
MLWWVLRTRILVKLEVKNVEEKSHRQEAEGINGKENGWPVLGKSCNGDADTLTVEACREFVKLKVQRARAVLAKRKEEMEVLLEEFKRETGVLSLLEHRAEYLRKQYKLDLVVLIERRGGRVKLAGSEVDQETHELEALVKKVKAEDACYYAWTDTRALAGKLSEAKEKMMHLANISAKWENEMDRNAASSFEELMRSDISEEEAFKNAGLECRCDNMHCDYPYKVDERHRNM